MRRALITTDPKGSKSQPPGDPPGNIGIRRKTGILALVS